MENDFEEVQGPVGGYFGVIEHAGSKQYSLGPNGKDLTDFEIRHYSTAERLKL